MRIFPCSLFAILMADVTCATAADWPNWRGPDHNGISREELPADLESAAVAWKAEVGTGFATVAVVGGRVFTMGNEAGHDIVWCLDAADGKPVWQHRYACALDPRYYEGGPGGTPTVEASTKSVYTLSKKGHAFCLDSEDGSVRWQRDLRKQHGLDLPEWSFASSPLIAGKLVIFNVGNAGWALDKTSGETVWRSGNERSGYATPVPLGESEVLVFSAAKLIAVERATGAVRWRHNWESSRGVNAADPIVSGRRVLVSSSSGAALLEAPAGADGRAPTQVWKNKNLRTYFNPGVLSDGHVYAIHGTTHGPTQLVCLDWASGETVWSEGGFGSGALMGAGGGSDMILFDKGQLTIFRGTPEKFVPRLRLQVLGGKCWTAPVLADGRVFCRNAAGQLACVELKPQP